VGCSAITLRKLEAEERRPSKQFAERLAEILQVSADDRAAFMRFARGDPFATPVTLPVEPIYETLTRREREVLGLLGQGFTAPEIAEQLILAVSTIKWHIQLIYGKLGVHRKRQALTRAAQLGLLAPVTASATTDSLPLSPATPELGHNLPLSLTSFIGREKEVAEVEHYLRTTRLVTLTGPGGMGKTRLAVETARRVLSEFPDGTWLVDLAPLTEAALVPQTLAAALGVPHAPGHPLADTIIKHLRPKRVLIILNNCEHLIEACASLAEQLLHACPQLTILATSREALNVGVEIAYAVSPLSLPSAEDIKSIAVLAQSDAVRLFGERAHALSPRFVLTAENAPTIAQICRQLDGIPLAIELAVARTKVLSPQQIAARLDDRFSLLADGSRTALPRHRTLQALFDWSYDLLSPAERELLQRLAVFAGGWTLESAEAVCVDHDELPQAAKIFKPHPSAFLEILQQLVAKSFVVTVERALETGPRFIFLETIRQYALARLTASGEAVRLRERHARYYLALAESDAPGVAVHSVSQAWLDRLELEHSNLRAALVWCQSEPGRPELVLRLTEVVVWLWSERMYWTKEVRGWVEAALAYPGIENNAHKLALTVQHLGLISARQGDYRAAETQYARCLKLFQALNDLPSCVRSFSWLAWAAREQGDAARARIWAQEGLSIASALGDEFAVCYANVALAEGDIMLGDLTAATALLEENMTLARRLVNTSAISWSLNLLGNIAQIQGQFKKATALHEQSLSLALEIGRTDLSVIYANQALGETALAQGQTRRAERHLVEGLMLSQDVGNRATMAWCLASLAGVAVLDEDLKRATKIWAAAEALRQSIGAREAPASRATRERLMTVAREQSGEAAFVAAWKAGESASVAEAIEEALRSEARAQIQQ
jgi:predicted ATPase/DNA-binding CsgD family transcriptional regulator